MHDATNTYIQKLVTLYTRYANEEDAEWSKKYLRNQFEFLGIRAPIRRKVTKEFIKDYGVPAKENIRDVIFSLWELPEREFQYAALDILEKVKKGLTPDDMIWLESLITKKSWWETIDTLSPRIFGYMFSTYPELISNYPDKWIEDNNFWIQRSAILYQLKYKEKTDEQRLFQYILRRANSDEFFIQKAIGWILREYAKTDPETVKSFVSEHTLKPLSQREALKHLSRMNGQ